MGNKLSELMSNPIYPATANGWRGTVICDTADVPSAPFGTFKAPSPRIALIMPPPNVLCRRISRGSAGYMALLAKLSWEPTNKANSEAHMPAMGPAIAKSNVAARFFGQFFRLVTLLVMPVSIEGTSVGGYVLI